MSRLIPRADISSAALFFVVVSLCFFNAFSALSARLIWSITSSWNTRATGEITVRVRGGDKATQQAVKLIEADRGIERARLLDRADAERLLKPWLGSTRIPEDLPLPGIIAARLKPGEIAGSGTMITDRIASRLTRLGLDFQLDNHADYRREIGRAIALIRTGTAVILLLLWLTTLAVISFATRAALSARRDIVEVLHLAGARDSFIAGLFERRFFTLGLKAGIAGAAAALAMMGLIGHGVGSSEQYAWLIPQLSVSLQDLAILGMTPIIAALAAMGAARATALRALAALA